MTSALEAEPLAAVALGGDIANACCCLGGGLVCVGAMAFCPHGPSCLSTEPVTLAHHTRMRQEEQGRKKIFKSST